MQTDFTKIARKSARLAAIPLACAGALAAAPLSAQSNMNPVVSTPLSGLGHGNFTAVVNAEEGQLCYMVNVHGVDDPTGAHIAQAGNDVASVTLENPDSGASGACQSVDAEIASSIATNPGAYEVRVTTQALPDGAIKGTLTK